MKQSRRERSAIYSRTTFVFQHEAHICVIRGDGEPGVIVPSANGRNGPWPDEWVFLTATDGNDLARRVGTSGALAVDESDSHERLRSLLSATAYRWVEGVGFGVDAWFGRAERGFAVTGMPVPEAHALARLFSQDAIVVGTRDRASVVWTDS